MKKFLVAAFFALTAMSAQAVSLSFKFEVASSGTSLYACNAGLKHARHSERVCYDRRDTSKSCNPKVCKAGQACNCVCTGGFDITSESFSDDGEFRLDFLAARVANWSDNGEAPTNIRTVRKTAGKNANLANTYSTVVEENQMFNNQLLSLNFELGSERYGAEYFVDVCFRAPQINYSGTFDNGDKINWGVNLATTITNIAGSNSGTDWNLDSNHTVFHSTPYHTLANLTTEATLICKVKGSTTPLEYNYGPSTFDAGQLVSFVNNLQIAKDLKGCYVRYTFKETNRSGLSSVRKWKKQQARICTYTSFNESSDLE